jgi:hypothetical protein
MVFGKRKPLANLETFAEKAAALADKAGIKTGGPDGHFRTESDNKERVARAYAELKLRTEQVNETLRPLVGPECQMVPFFLIPESCWVGETGQYLVEFLDLTPYGAWNTAFLPGNQWTAALVGTALHPRAEAPEFTATIKKLILDSKAKTDLATAKVGTTGDLQLMTTARSESLALILTAAKKVAAAMAKLGKPDGPDHRVGLAFLSLECIDYRRG